MNVFTVLMVATVLAVSALFLALALFLTLISSELRQIGGVEAGYGTKASYLSKIRVGVRAIETETGMIAPQVTKLNGTLTQIRDGLVVVDGNLAALITAVTKQEA